MEQASGGWTHRAILLITATVSVNQTNKKNNKNAGRRGPKDNVTITRDGDVVTQSKQKGMGTHTNHSILPKSSISDIQNNKTKKARSSTLPTPNCVTSLPSPIFHAINFLIKRISALPLDWLDS